MFWNIFYVLVVGLNLVVAVISLMLGDYWETVVFSLLTASLIFIHLSNKKAEQSHNRIARKCAKLDKQWLDRNFDFNKEEEDIKSPKQWLDKDFDFNTE